MIACRSIRATAFYLLYLAIATAIVLLLVELFLRVFLGLPRGLYDFRTGDGSTLYRPNVSFKMVWAPIPYTLTTNSLGLRGDEIAREKTPGVTRIVALGDSITEGFYVDNDATYPHYLQEALRANGTKCEVATVAEGDSSIDREMELYRKYAKPLKPDVVVLGCTSNDIDNLRAKTLEQILHKETPVRDLAGRSTWILFAHTALGECILDGSLRLTVPKYRRNRAEPTPEELARRYEIPGWDNVPANLAVFDAMARRTDGIIRHDDFTPKENEDVAKYTQALAAFHRELTADGVKLYVVYFPDYPEVYDPARRFPLPSRIAETCRAENIPFLDLTPAYKNAAQDKTRALYLAPTDFHPTPAGNKMIGTTVAAFLSAQSI